MSKDYSEGDQHGHEDGKTGDNRLASRSFKRLGKLGSYLPGAQNRDAQYRKGYVNAFEDEVRVKRVTPASADTHENQTHTSGGPAMSHATSFAHQIELLQHLKQYLADFQERLMGVSANYQSKVDALHGEGGLMDETHRDFVENQLAPTRALIARLIEHIGDNDIPAVEREISYLEQKL